MSVETAAWILGLDIGGSKTAVVAGTVYGQVSARVEVSSGASRGFAPMWADIVRAARTLTQDREPPCAIGVSVGGPLDSQRGVIYSPPNLPGWDQIPLKDLLEAEFDTPAFIEHDAKACALAEWMFGAGRGTRDMVFLTFGTGLGAGLILNGALYRGATDLAGEVGHWRIADDGPLIYGKEGSWEGYASGAGIAALTHYLYPGRFAPGVTAAEVIAMGRTGDTAARQVIEVSARYLGRGIAQIIDLLNPQMIVLGSLAVRAGDIILPVAIREARLQALPAAFAGCQILPARLADAIGDVAAICAALHRL